MAEFTEVAHRVWVARYAQHDVNVVVVAGADGVLLVDTGESEAVGREIARDVRGLGAGEVTAVVNTHDHFDHVGGNPAFAGVPVHAHESAAVVDVTHPFSSVRVLDLGGRTVELVHPGRGHTSGDTVVRVPDVDVLLAGDLVEESAPPSYGEDSWPFEWPLALDVVLSLTTSASVVVPGHGATVDRDFVEQQRAEIGIVAETIRDLAGRGVPVVQALGAGSWPFPAEALGEAVARGFEQLPRSQKRLPLV
ncbi:MBL fold metallo-hydrolase [Nocardioides houyundeii]|uniref:MBL fold metallo-hydrolase n=1 Tax=Nocardioides houyundeii TaxID=2045452 RepID=UPI000C77217A|nr:MBL fold metallo-hydrolase [Nocardioides houyundeii]